MKQYIYFCITLILATSCGLSEGELRREQEIKIDKTKSEIDEHFNKIINLYYLDFENVENSRAYKNITSKVKSKELEISEYAKTYIDSVATLKNKLHELKYYALLEYAKEQGWDKLSAQDFQKVEHSIKVKGDEFNSSIQYRHPNSPKFVNYNGFFLYYVKNYESADKAQLFLRSQYRDDDWLFCKSAKISIDGKVFSPNFREWERDHNSGHIFEWSTESSPSYNLIVNILTSKKAKIRYRGDKYHDDRTITLSQKAHMKKILKAYYGLYLKDVLNG